jgi:hypothetical protein
MLLDLGGEQGCQINSEELFSLAFKNQAANSYWFDRHLHAL